MVEFTKTYFNGYTIEIPQMKLALSHTNVDDDTGEGSGMILIARKGEYGEAVVKDKAGNTVGKLTMGYNRGTLAFYCNDAATRVALMKGITTDKPASHGAKLSWSEALKQAREALAHKK